MQPISDCTFEPRAVGSRSETAWRGSRAIASHRFASLPGEQVRGSRAPAPGSSGWLMMVSKLRGRGMSTASSRMTRPGRADITMTRSARKIASRDSMRDQQHRLAAGLPDALQFQVHPLARQRIQRAERLVHQQDARVAHQRAADAGTLLHAAREFIRIALGEIGRARSSPAAGRCPRPRRCWRSADAERQRHVLAHRQPGQQVGGLEHHADVGATGRDIGRRPAPRPWCRSRPARPGCAAACSCRSPTVRRRRRTRRRGFPG